MSRLLSIGLTATLLASASAASAVTYHVASAGLYTYGTVNMAGSIAGYGPFNRNEYAGAVVLQGTTDGGKPFTVTTYCFDILHNISVGFGYQANVNYNFSMQPVSNDLTGNGGTGNALSSTQIERMSGLANLGAWMFANNVSNLTARMSAIQAAIWSVEYGFTASNFSAPNALGYYNTYMARSFPGATTRVLVSSDAQGQILGNMQGLGIGSVPEPEAWALMVIGFGLVGAGMRRRSPVNTVLA